MKSKINYLLLLIIIGVSQSSLAFAAPFVGPLVKCGRSGDNPCSIGDLVLGVYVIINFLIGFATVLAMAYIVIGGVRMILAAGDPAGVTSAKTTMTNAIIGLVTIVMSYVILTSVISYFTGLSFAQLADFFHP